MSSEGVTVTGLDLYDVRRKLGVHAPWISIDLSGDLADPNIRMVIAGNSYMFTRVEPLLRVLKREVDKRIRQDKVKKKRRNNGSLTRHRKATR